MPTLAVEAAALRLPSDAVYGGLTAAWLHGLDVQVDPYVDSLVVHDGGISARAVLRVRRAGVQEDEIELRRGYRVTNVERTLADICSHLPLVEAVVMVDMALQKGLTDLDRLAAKAAARAGLAGVRRFRRTIELADAGAESPMETRLRLLLVLAGLAHPETQVELRDRFGALLGRTDLYYRAARLAIEYDGEVHRHSLTDDLRRQNRLVESGFRILRFTAPDVYGTPDAVVQRVRAALAA